MDTPPPTALRRVISLPWLVFYGVGVTVGAGIFVLIGDVLRVSGDHAVWSFLLAGLVAAITGYSYVLLAGAFPRAAGEALFVKTGMGRFAGGIAGYAVVAVAVTSSAVIGLAFARYFAVLVNMPEPLAFAGLVAALAAVAVLGVKESVVFAGLITLIEVGALLLVIAVNAGALQDAEALTRALAPPLSLPAWQAVASGAFLAFFAFIGFEDIENMAEETRDAHRTVPLAIILTLVISVAVYGAVAVIAAAHPARALLVTSKTPLADLYAQATGRPGTLIAGLASIAMVNGVLVQVVMAARVLYGMSREEMAPSWLGRLHATRQTPAAATLLVASVVVALGLGVPLVTLAEMTSLVMLLVFAAVNVSLYLIGRRAQALPPLRRWRLWGLFGAAVALLLAAGQLLTS